MTHRPYRWLLFTLVLAALLAATAVLLAQDEDIISLRSIDYLNDTSIAMPEGDAVDTSAFAKDEPYTIGFINWSTANSWTVQIVEEVRDEASLYPEIGEFIIVSSEGDADTQISQIEDMIVRGVDALLLIPVSPDAIVPAMEEAAAAGIPIVVFAADVNTDVYVTKLLTDSVQFGRVQGDWLMEQLECQGNIIVLNGVTGISTSDNRRLGLQQAIEACPDGGAGITILAEEDAAWAYDQGKLATERMLAAYPEIDGVWSQGGAMTQGAIDAFEAAGRPLVPMTGEDNNGFLLAWQARLADGFKAMSASEPTWQSRVALQAALRIRSTAFRCPPSLKTPLTCTCARNTPMRTGRIHA
ncbi:MAG: substrate-binding domain-containing protein [Anaerolineae bacterium]|nr:substrate-binding domain-containing protein [Anaerolineae bacterium]